MSTKLICGIYKGAYISVFNPFLVKGNTKRVFLIFQSPKALVCLCVTSFLYSFEVWQWNIIHKCTVPSILISSEQEKLRKLIYQVIIF